jgi:hypothetical protein
MSTGSFLEQGRIAEDLETGKGGGNKHKTPPFNPE